MLTTTKRKLSVRWIKKKTLYALEWKKTNQWAEVGWLESNKWRRKSAMMQQALAECVSGADGRACSMFGIKTTLLDENMYIVYSIYIYVCLLSTYWLLAIIVFDLLMKLPQRHKTSWTPNSIPMSAKLTQPIVNLTFPLSVLNPPLSLRSPVIFICLLIS